MVAPLVIGALIGLAKAKSDADKEKRQRQEKANTQRYSPWTGMEGDPIQMADPVGAIGQGALAGAMYGQQSPASAETSGMTDVGAPLQAGQTPLLSAQNPAPGQSLNGWGGIQPWTAQQPPYKPPGSY